MMTRSGIECAVVGGGVVGLSVALEVARGGARVAVFERGQRTGMGTSSAAAGMLAAAAESRAPGAFFELCLRSAESWPRWAERLREESGIDCELEASGLVRVTNSAEGATDLEVRRTWQRTNGVEVSEVLNLDALRAEVPGLGPEVVAGLVYPDVGHVHSHRVMEALAEACRRSGVEINTGREVTAIIPEDSRVRAGGDGFEIETQHLVLAAGPWGGGLLASLGLPLQVEPVRGQMLAVRPPGRLLPRIVFGDGGYVLQKRSGLVLMGATEELAGFELRTTLEGVAAVAERGRRLIPELGSAEFVASWAGLRPMVEGGPLIGGLPDHPRVLLALGHHRNGILLAPETARLVAASIQAGSDDPGLSPFSPRRRLAAAG